MAIPYTVYAAGAKAAQAYAKTFVDNPANGVPEIFQGEAENFIALMAAPMARAVIDATVPLLTAPPAA